MNLRTLLWNIGGCRIRKSQDDPKDIYSFCNEGLDHVLKTMRQFNADILFLQESRVSKDYDQTKIISKELNLPNINNDVLSESHLDRGFKTGIAIISKYPLLNHQLVLFTNPEWRAKGYKGERWFSFNRGFVRADVKINNLMIQVNNALVLPFHHFKKDPLSKSLKKLRENMVKKLKSAAPRYLLQGDFNFNKKSLKALLPEFLDENTHEVKITNPTCPDGTYHDHIVYRGLKLKKYEIYTNVLTDHYPIYSEFEIYN